MAAWNFSQPPRGARRQVHENSRRRGKFLREREFLTWFYDKATVKRDAITEAGVEEVPRTFSDRDEEEPYHEQTLHHFAASRTDSA